jgi:hypothetical protein
MTTPQNPKTTDFHPLCFYQVDDGMDEHGIDWVNG